MKLNNIRENEKNMTGNYHSVNYSSILIIHLWARL